MTRLDRITAVALRLAVEWYREAARHGYVLAQEAIGEMYEFGEGVRPDHENALKWIRKAMVTDSSAALGIAYRYDKGARWGLSSQCRAAPVGPRNPAKAIEWYRVSSDAGSVVAQTYLGELYESESTVQDLEEAVRWYRKAGQTWGRAMAHLARLYATGRGIQQDYVEAAQWYGKAMATDGQTGRYELGLLYEQGLGVAQDRQKAMELYYGAAGGNADAQARLFKLYEAGLDLPSELTQAIAWYEAAAEQGNRRARVGLGLHYQFGRGVPLNLIVADALYTIARQASGPPEDIPGFIKPRQDLHSSFDDATRALVNEMGRPGNLLKSIEWCLAHPPPEVIEE